MGDRLLKFLLVGSETLKMNVIEKSIDMQASKLSFRERILVVYNVAVAQQEVC